MNIDELHNEKLVAHSRELEPLEICDDCDQDWIHCGCDAHECQEAAEQDAAESNWEGARDAYD